MVITLSSPTRELVLLHVEKRSAGGRREWDDFDWQGLVLLFDPSDSDLALR